MRSEQTRRWQPKRYRSWLPELAELSGVPEAALRKRLHQGTLIPVDLKAALVFGVNHHLMTNRLLFANCTRALAESRTVWPWW